MEKGKKLQNCLEITLDVMNVGSVNQNNEGVDFEALEQNIRTLEHWNINKILFHRKDTEQTS